MGKFKNRKIPAQDEYGQKIIVPDCKNITEWAFVIFTSLLIFVILVVLSLL